MLNRFFNYFNLFDELENHKIVIERISKDSVFRGTNLWILVFAIFIASLGLNINSTAVIIGAMLISPLMGPIMGMGMGIAINDLVLAKEAVKNFSFSVIVSLITSFIYFSITPLNSAYSELLARTSPTIYDVMIALFGGLAGILANSSKQKGNIVPGVAIATALMPPLCTAGYGLATFQLNFFFGAIYLFTINTVFIALATFLTLKFLKYPLHHLTDPKLDKRSLRFITIITILTIIPSIYFGYEMVRQNKYLQNANLFIESVNSIEGTYLLNKSIDPQKRSIVLIFGGKDLSEFQIKNMKTQLEIFGLTKTALQIKQGFSSLQGKKESERITWLTQKLAEKDQFIQRQNILSDSMSNKNKLSNQILRELQINYPIIKALSIKPSFSILDSSRNMNSIVIVNVNKTLSSKTKSEIEKWLRIRLHDSKIRLKEIY